MNEKHLEHVKYLCGRVLENNRIDQKYYERFDVKKGLRNEDGSGVLAGITNICNVHGYVISEGEKEPTNGELIFRGYNIRDIVENKIKEDRFGFEEIIYLLLFILIILTKML